MNFGDGKTITDFHSEGKDYILKPNEIADPGFAVNQGLRDNNGLYNFIFEAGQVRLRTVLEKAPDLATAEAARKNALLNSPAIKAFIEELETLPQFVGLRGKIEGRL